MNIYLIRHTTPDIELIYCYGQTDLDVKDSFDDEVSRIKSVLPKLDNFKIFSSPLKRCAKLAKALDVGKVIFDDRLKEFNFGEWEMKPWDDIEKESLNFWIEDFVNRQAPGGESYRQMSDRIMDFFGELKNSDSENIILVSHGGTIRAILANILEMPLKNLFNINIDFAGVVKLSEKNGKIKVMFINR
ncbi:MAG: alpha-ribazole phosphatase [Calditrichaeota bacterium]|nr:MAG: alpha-ribazole phosphatase [Calditrichota bacterium]MBL1204511.1 alpha-ribazole phosphatase [Calditrichota bacterium]NOG44340.1 alpha-ribazole phosphatase [Calditrichota bacterium]